jgi:nitrogen regulatory protein P-II 1
MKLVIIFLNRPELLEEVLEGFIEIGVSGATVVDTVGMGQILSHEVPIFAGLRRAFPGTSPVNKTIFLVTDEHLVREIVDVVEDVCGSLDVKGSGMAFVMNVDQVIGMGRGIK